MISSFSPAAAFAALEGLFPLREWMLKSLCFGGDRPDLWFDTREGSGSPETGRTGLPMDGSSVPFEGRRGEVGVLRTGVVLLSTRFGLGVSAPWVDR